VTGKRAPCSSHIAVIPRFRAITPVRRDIGVHLGIVDSTSAWATALWWTVLLMHRGERRASGQTRNMGQVNRVFGHARPQHNSPLSLLSSHAVTHSSWPLPTPTSHIHAVSLVPSSPLLPSPLSNVASPLPLLLCSPSCQRGVQFCAL
jgi:hypothetical protein